MIRWIREKFRGSIYKKYRKLYREWQDINVNINRLERRRKRLAGQLVLIDKIKKAVGIKDQQQNKKDAHAPI